MKPSGRLVGRIWAIAWPVMTATALTQSLSLVDMGFIARLGTTAVAAASAASTVVRLITGVGTGIATAVLALSARFFGAKQPQSVAAVARHGMLVALGVGFTLCGIASAAARPIVSIFSADAVMIELGTSYLRFMLGGLVFLFVYLATAAVFQAAGDTKTPLVVVAVVNLVNVALDPVLMFGWFGMPALGIAGAGVASMVGHAVGAVAMVTLLVHPRRSPIIGMSIRFRWAETTLVRNILRIGAPASAQALTRPLSGMVLHFVVSLHGTVALAAFGLGLKLSMFSSVFMAGLTAAVGALVGRELGRGDAEGAREVVRVGSAVGTGIFFAVATGYFVLSRPLMGVFVPEPEVLRTGVQYLRILAPSLVLLGAMGAFSGAFQGSGDTAALMRTAFWANGPVKLGAALILGFVWPARLGGVWVAIAVSIMVETVLLFRMYKSGRWYQRTTIRWSGRENTG